MINKLNNKEIITINMFGKEKNVKVISTGDNKYDENGNLKKYNFELNSEELDILNWFINNIKIEDYKKEIMDYCNQEYSAWSYTKIGIEDIKNEIDIHTIAINKTARNNPDYPEISFYGECKCDEEHGICIGFRNKKFLGISSQDWTL